MANGSGFEDNIISAKGMRVVHLSYARITDYKDPDKWLKRINFFVALAEEMAKYVEVKSVHCIDYSGMLKRNAVEYHFMKCSKKEMMFPSRLHQYIKERLNPEVIIVHGVNYPFQVLLLKRTIQSAKIIIQHHSERPLRHIKFFLQRSVDDFASAYFFPSFEQALPWIEKRLIASPDKVHEVTEVPSVFSPIERQNARAVTNVKGSKVYLWVGRFDSNKDPITLIKGFAAFAQTVSGSNLYIIFQRNELIKEVTMLLEKSKDLLDRIVLVGKVEHDQLLNWFNSADFIISTSHYEGMGVAVCEGMSCGCIPVLSDIPSFKKMTGNGDCGVHFSPGDADDLRIKLIQTDSIDIPSFREKVLKRYEATMSAKAIARKMISVCEDALRGR